MIYIIVILAILILIVNGITIYINPDKLNRKTRIISLILTIIILIYGVIATPWILFFLRSIYYGWKENYKNKYG